MSHNLYVVICTIRRSSRRGFWEVFEELSFFQTLDLFLAIFEETAVGSTPHVTSHKCTSIYSWSRDQKFLLYIHFCRKSHFFVFFLKCFEFFFLIFTATIPKIFKILNLIFEQQFLKKTIIAPGNFGAFCRLFIFLSIFGWILSLGKFLSIFWIMKNI